MKSMKKIIKFAISITATRSALEMSLALKLLNVNLSLGWHFIDYCVEEMLVRSFNTLKPLAYNAVSIIRKVITSRLNLCPFYTL